MNLGSMFFFDFFFYVNIFKNTNTYPINDLYYETSLCRITLRFSRVGGLLIFVKLWGMFKSNFFLNFFEFFLCLVGASLQMVAFFYPVDPRGLIMYKRGVLVRSSKYWERNAVFFSLIGGLQYYEWKREAWIKENPVAKEEEKLRTFLVKKFMPRNYIGFLCFPKTENKLILSKQWKEFLNLKAFFGKDKMYPNKKKNTEKYN